MPGSAATDELLVDTAAGAKTQHVYLLRAGRFPARCHVQHRRHVYTSDDETQRKRGKVRSQ